MRGSWSKRLLGRINDRFGDEIEGWRSRRWKKKSIRVKPPAILKDAETVPGSKAGRITVVGSLGKK